MIIGQARSIAIASRMSAIVVPGSTSSSLWLNPTLWTIPPVSLRVIFMS